MADEIKLPHVVDDVRTEQNFMNLESSINKMRGSLQESYDKLEEELEQALGDYLRKDGTVELTANWQAGNWKSIFAGHFVANVTLQMKEQSSAPEASANYGKLYTKSSDARLYFKDSSGNEYQISKSQSGIMYVATNQTESAGSFMDCVGISFPVEANASYGFTIVIKHTNSKWAKRFTGPSGYTSFFAESRHCLTSNTWHFERVQALESTMGVASITDNSLETIDGFFINGANAGTIQMQIKTNGSNPYTVLAGSWGQWHRTA